MKIGILGSACDPPHRAHIKIAEEAKRALKLDRIIFIPTKVPPHKVRPGVSEKMRLEMARLAAGKRKGWIVSDMELRRRGKSYTRDTIEELKKRYPHDRLFWIVGSDSLVSMPWKWKGGYDLLDLCTFVVARRKGYSPRGVRKHILKKVIVLGGVPYSISSTHIRKLLAQGKDVRRFLDDRVLAYIQKHHLYKGLGLNSGARNANRI